MKKVVVMSLLVALGLSGFAQKNCCPKKDELKTEIVFPGDWGDKPTLSIPEVDEIERVENGKRPSMKAMKNTEYILSTATHKAIGDAYVILTDHTDAEYLKSLNKLAKYRKAEIIQTADLANLYKDEKELKKLHKQLMKLKPKYAAIAPRLESYRENMLLGVYELLCNLDDDPLLDAYPGVLIASDAEKFEALVERTINYEPMTRKALAPAAICMIPNQKELRSLQKNGIIHNLFADYGYDAPMLNIYKKNAVGGPLLSGDKSYNMTMQPKQFVKHIPDSMSSVFIDASLWVLHGHGLPGVSCGVDIDALSEPLNSKVILCGSCFSASTQHSDLTPMKISPDGFPIVPREAFALKALDQGAAVVFGHMRLNSGFPRLMPVLETFLQGRTVGEAYQELINGDLLKMKFDSHQLAVREKPENPRRIKQNILLYVLFGDPALQPIEKMM
ncbi:hypothetical protein EYV94_23155 [Puteibacter caeruleilacunae]|nr:hypothetical protein EYV94_23155 [Puteibacter caeruleilacunae]